MKEISIADELTKILESEVVEIRKAADTAFKETSKAAADRLKSTSPEDDTSGPHYKDGWRAKKVNGMDYVAYNATKPGLTHLLENGHAKVSGGYVPGIEHIGPVNEWAAEEAVRKVKTELNK